jgi:hypothetical protein
MSPNTNYRERNTLRAVRNDPQFSLKETANTYLFTLHLRGEEGPGAYQAELVKGWTLDFSARKSYKQWVNHKAEHETCAFFPATAPELTAIIDTLYTHREHPEHKKLIAHIAKQFPKDEQVVTMSGVNYLPNSTYVMHCNQTTYGYHAPKLEGPALELEKDGPVAKDTCKALLGTGSTRFVNNALHWLTGRNAVLMPHAHRQNGEIPSRVIAFGNRDEMRSAPFYLLDADCSPNLELCSVGIRILNRIA